MPNEVVIRVAGRAGDGSYSTCGILSKVAQRMGYYVFEHRDVHSNIQGLPTAFTARISLRPRHGLPDEIDGLVCFDGEGLFHAVEIRRGGFLLYDGSVKNPAPHGKGAVLTNEQIAALAERGVMVFSAPFADIAKKRLHNPVMRNTIALGVVAELLSIPAALFEEFIRKEYGTKKKGEEIVAGNLAAYNLGVGLKRTNDWRLMNGKSLMPQGGSGKLLILGNEIIAFGALVGGCRGFAGYPITPASEVFEFELRHLMKEIEKGVKQFGGVAVQADSEIAAISMVVGMSHAGLRAMTATSGPGLSLMQEALSGAGMTETPVVIAHVQRGGPSTGLPTRSSQEDLQQVIYGGHGEFPRIVIVPATPEEGFLFGALALNLAEKFQCLVFILTEKEFGQSRYTMDEIPFEGVSIDRGKIFDPASKEEYKRYEYTEDGVSPRVFPGTAGLTSMSSTTEHDEHGYATEDIASRNAIVEKRMRKEKTAQESGLLPAAVLEGSGARIGIISFGSTYGPIEDAREFLGENAPDFLRLRTVWPFPAEEVKDFIETHERVLVVECNFAGQLRRLIQQEAVGPSPKIISVRKYDGRPFKPNEIVESILAAGAGKEA